MTYHARLNTAADTLLAIAACCAAAGADTTDTTEIAAFMHCAARSGDTLTAAARLWCKPGTPTAVYLPADLVPWDCVRTEALYALRDALAVLPSFDARFRDIVLACISDLDDLRARLDAGADARTAVVAHVLARRSAASSVVPA